MVGTKCFLLLELIQQWDLLDFKPMKGLFTWTNNRVGMDHISTHLDRFLVQSSLIIEKRIISSKILPKLTSDHKPILLQLEEEENLGPIPFRHSPLWTEKEGFLETVNSAWSTPVTGSPSYAWEQKIKTTKHALKEWIKKPNKTPPSHRREIVQQLTDLQMEMENKDITNQYLEKEHASQFNSFRAFRQEEEYWRLKYHSLWLRARDRNTTFFHQKYRA